MTRKRGKRQDSLERSIRTIRHLRAALAANRTNPGICERRANRWRDMAYIKASEAALWRDRANRAEAQLYRTRREAR